MISTVIIAKNEEANIASCIKSVLFSDEIVIIDNGSIDDTVSIAKKMKARVVEFPLEKDFSNLRNRGLEEAQFEWILCIDADERVSEILKHSILSELASPRYSSYFLKRRDHFWGSIMKYGEVRNAYVRGYIRLMKKGEGKWSGVVHEIYQDSKPSGFLEGFIEHYPHGSLSEFIRDVNQYSSLRAEELHKKKKTTNMIEICIVPIFKFFYTYILKFGFFDGHAGFVYSFLMSFHSFLVRSKLYMMKS
ncbi:hypothetical protein CO051_07025 [Candidatus Roizmanbacteria bacterium CG_4_9_14_0_2_um_filter_39_13]|uniref:Glycosyltransferase 2-like domain-containing protein n=2 Tax=Candidatus Roizmaniibacteriota TaxID=1752723 RepID=A0A2M8EWF8_9BACT|nr:MAG: hypothetical protein CO051_07025 [Candidatus Roizmanbacteria bacterium CG_4_9_14_0_2_um_filter_39_13]